MKENYLNSLKLENICISIGQLAQLLKVNQRTLRIYEEQGLIVPKRSEGNRRLYNVLDYEKIEFILYLTRNLALNLAGVKLIFDILKKLNIDKNYIEFIKEVSSVKLKEENINIVKSLNKGRKRKTTSTKIIS